MSTRVYGQIDCGGYDTNPRTLHHLLLSGGWDALLAHVEPQIPGKGYHRIIVTNPGGYDLGVYGGNMMLFQIPDMLADVRCAQMHDMTRFDHFIKRLAELCGLTPIIYLGRCMTHVGNTTVKAPEAAVWEDNAAHAAKTIGNSIKHVCEALKDARQTADEELIIGIDSSALTQPGQIGDALNVILKTAGFETAWESQPAPGCLFMGCKYAMVMADHAKTIYVDKQMPSWATSPDELELRGCLPICWARGNTEAEAIKLAQDVLANSKAAVSIGTYVAITADELEHPVTPIPPTNVVRTSGYFIPKTGGPWYISNEAVSGTPFGVLCNNDQAITGLHLKNCVFNTKEYSLYCGNVAMCTLDTFSFTTNGPIGNDYTIRGSIGWLDMKEGLLDNRIGNNACVRVYNCMGGLWKGCAFKGGPLILGGGADNHKIDHLPFQNVVIDDFDIDYTNTVHVSAVMMYSKTHNVTIRNGHAKIRDGAKFAYIDPLCTNLTFENVTVQMGGNPIRPLKWSDFQNGDALKASADVRNIKVIP